MRPAFNDSAVGRPLGARAVLGVILALWFGMLPVPAFGEFRGFLPAIPALPGAMNRMVFVAPYDGIYLLYSSSGLGTLSAKGVRGEALEVTVSKGESLEVWYRYEGDLTPGEVMDEAVVAELAGHELSRAAFHLGMVPAARKVEVPLAIKGLPRPIFVDVYDQRHPSLDLRGVLKLQGEILLGGAVEIPGCSSPMDPTGWAVLPPDFVSGDVTVLCGLISRSVGGTFSPTQFRLELKEAELPDEWSFLLGLVGQFDQTSLGMAVAQLPKGAMEAGYVLGSRSKASHEAAAVLCGLLRGSDAARAFLRGYLKGANGAMVAVGPGAAVRVTSPSGGPHGGVMAAVNGWTCVIFPRKDRVLLSLTGDGSAPVEVVKLLPEGEVRRSYPAGRWSRRIEVIGDRLNPSGRSSN